MFHHLLALASVQALRLREHARGRADGGYSTETIAVTAFLVALALAALAILGPKVLDKIKGVTL